MKSLNLVFTAICEWDGRLADSITNFEMFCELT